MDTHKYLLDTNILSHLIRNPSGPVFEYLESILTSTACTSIIVSAKIQYGLRKSGSEKLRNQADKVLEKTVDNHYGEIRTFLKRTGTPIGGNDLFIAAHALALDLILVTANVREFSCVPKLRLENWLE